MPASSQARSAQGFTLLELMITIAVLAIIVALAVPSFTSLLNSNRLSTGANNVVAGLQVARMEAVRRNTPVTFCRSANRTSCQANTAAWASWLVIIPATNEVLQTAEIKAPLQVSSTAAMASVTFGADGIARDGAGTLAAGTVRVCMPTSRPAENIRNVDIVGGSRVSVDSANGGGAC